MVDVQLRCVLDLGCYECSGVGVGVQYVGGRAVMVRVPRLELELLHTDVFCVGDRLCLLSPSAISL